MAKKTLHRLTKNVKILQKAVLIHNNEILILKRSESSKNRPLCWDLPGGNSEWPKNVVDNKQNMHQEDIAREIKEETDLTVFAEHFKQENMVLFRTFYEAEKDIYTVIIGWKVELPGDFDRKQFKLSNEHVGYAWISMEEINDYDFGGRRGEFVKDIIRGAM